MMQKFFCVRNVLREFLIPSVLAMTLVALVGCGSGAATADNTTGGGTPTPASVALATNSVSVKSDGSDSATLTVTVLDASNALIPNQAVQLSATTGVLGASTIVTDTTGRATVVFNGGSAINGTNNNGVNRTAVVTASISGTSLTSSIPIAISGSTLTLTSTTNNATAGAPIALTATARNAAGTPIPGQTVRFSVATSSTGSGTLSATTVTTANTGTVGVNLTGTAAGTVNVLAEWLDSNGTATASTTASYTITASAGTAFQITAPAASPSAVTLGSTLGVTVNVPATVNGVAVSNIRFSTALGTWQSSGTAVQTVPFTAAGNYTQTFVAGVNAGVATVQIDALNAAGTVIASANLALALSAPATSAARVILTALPTNIPLSRGGNLSTSALTATVLDAANNPVSNAAVLFSLANPSGGGEQISPVIVTTGNGTNGTAGVANSTFTAGSLSTNQQSQIRATVLGTTIQDTATITVGGTAGSISVGTSTAVASSTDQTLYQLPVSVLVTDSNGNAVSGAVVSISLWPQGYYKGVRGTGPADTSCTVTASALFPNEDVNENLILDPGEDIDGPGGLTVTTTIDPLDPTHTKVIYQLFAAQGAPDGSLWPPAASAGSVPSQVTTDAAGTASFTLTYLKTYANWVAVRLRLSTPVSGTETVTTYTTVLPVSIPDAQVTPCILPNSPFN